MHAYLLIGNNNELIEQKTIELAKVYNSEIINFSLTKIEDVRELIKFCKLSYSEGYAIQVSNIEKLSIEASNAFLKILEEPQEKITFILTANNINSLLPTIISRCQVVRIKNQEERIKNQDLENFITKDKIGKLEYVAKLKTKDEALDFLENLISLIHQNITNMPDPKFGHKALDSLKAIKANGNISIQLTNFVVNSSIQT